MKYLVLFLSMAATMILAAPTPAASDNTLGADSFESRDEVKVEKLPRFELPRSVLETATEASTDGGGNWAPI